MAQPAQKPLRAAKPVTRHSHPRGDTRERLLEVAEAAVLAKGFSATSIEELISAVGITKGGFFYHFKDKGELARALMLRYLDHDRQVLDDIFARGDATDSDPLIGFLAGLALFADTLAQLKEAHPGCLAASFTYQDQLFDRDVRALNAEGILAWRQRFRARFDLIASAHPPREPVDFDALADMAATLVEGGLILGRALGDAAILPKQILLYRDFVQAIFR